MECPICCDSFNKSTRAPITCTNGECGYTACKACVRTFLTSTTKDASCMNCGHKWNQRFCVLNLNRSFMVGDYRDHRGKLLLDREVSRLPESMEAAGRYEEVKEKEAEREEILRQRRELLEQAEALLHQSYGISRQISRLERRPEKAERKKFVMPCVSETCRGFLSTQYKCEICKLYTCPDCFEIIGASKEVPHTCTEEAKASATLIRQETRACPTCGIRISKISGCDQMWCTECHTAFSWRTGQVETGVVHNPHFYQYQRQAKEEGRAGAGQRALTMCNGQMPSYHELQSYCLRPLRRYAQLEDGHAKMEWCDKAWFTEEVAAMDTWAMQSHRVISHLIYSDLRPLERRIRAEDDTEKLRVRYIVGEISKEEMHDDLLRRDKVRRRSSEMVDLYNLLRTAGTEAFRSMVNARTDDPKLLLETCQTARKDIEWLREYMAEQLDIISATYNCSVPDLTRDWRTSMRKARLSDVRKKEAGTADQEDASIVAEEENVVVGASEVTA